MATTASNKQQSVEDTHTIIGWQGVLFNLPPEWNLTGFSMDRANGYVKVDSPGTMFVQVKWSMPRRKRPNSIVGMLMQAVKRDSANEPVDQEAPDLKAMLETFLKQTGKAARKSKTAFEYKIKPETQEADGERVAHNFTWTGGGQGQGKIWYCRGCGRVVIAQVVGQAKENIASVAAQLFSSLRDHTDDAWEVWALYDMVAATPVGFELKSQKLMSGYLKLDFEKRNGQRIVLERWGLANVTKKKFTIRDWFKNACSLGNYKTTSDDMVVQGHEAVRAKGAIRGVLPFGRAMRDGLMTLTKPATMYDACCWECDETNKIYAIQVWHNARTEAMLGEVTARCECH